MIAVVAVVNIVISVQCIWRIWYYSPISSDNKIKSNIINWAPHIYFYIIELEISSKIIQSMVYSRNKENLIELMKEGRKKKANLLTKRLIRSKIRLIRSNKCQHLALLWANLHLNSNNWSKGGQIKKLQT